MRRCKLNFMKFGPELGDVADIKWDLNARGRKTMLVTLANPISANIDQVKKEREIQGITESNGKIVVSIDIEPDVVDKKRFFMSNKNRSNTTSGKKGGSAIQIAYYLM